MKVKIICEDYKTIPFKKVLKSWDYWYNKTDYEPPNQGNLEISLQIDDIELSFYPHHYNDLLKLIKVKETLEGGSNGKGTI